MINGVLLSDMILLMDLYIRDLMNINGDVKKTPLFNQDNNSALTFAENDLKSN